MILETAVSSLVIEFVRPLFKKVFKRKNNKPEISAMKRDMPTFETVGELRELLNAFSDDTPIMGGSYEYAHIQIIDWIGRGRICFGSSSSKIKD